MTSIKNIEINIEITNNMTYVLNHSNVINIVFSYLVFNNNR